MNDIYSGPQRIHPQRVRNPLVWRLLLVGGIIGVLICDWIILGRRETRADAWLLASLYAMHLVLALLGGVIWYFQGRAVRWSAIVAIAIGSWLPIVALFVVLMRMLFESGIIHR